MGNLGKIFAMGAVSGLMGGTAALAYHGTDKFLEKNGEKICEKVTGAASKLTRKTADKMDSVATDMEQAAE